MSQYMRKLRRKMSGMEPKMKTITMTKIRATLILSHPGTVINNLEVAEGIIR